MKCPWCGGNVALDEVQETHYDDFGYNEVCYAWCCNCHWTGHVKLFYKLEKEEIINEESDC